MSDPDQEQEQDPPESSSPGRGTKDSRRRRLESVIPEIIKRAVELGVEKAQEAPDNLKQFVGDLKLPKEIAHYLLAQIDETKNGLFRVVAKEIRDFLEHTNFAGEMQKILTTVQFEINTTIRFTPNNGRTTPRKERDRPKDEGATEESSPEIAEGDEEHPDGLPKPEVKATVNVRREERERRRRGRSG